MKRPCCFLFILLFLNVNLGIAQPHKVKFYDVIRDDSLVMYFNTSMSFCAKECASFKRYVRLDSKAEFNRDFIDSSTSNNLIAKGHYDNGVKNGNFFMVIPIHGLYVQGAYKDNLPFGTWQYYYSNGMPERKVVITDTDTSLIEFFDQSGKQLVKDGDGFFVGRVHVPGSRMDNRVISSGKIENGKASGEWTATLSGFAYNSEKLQSGVLVSGTTPETKFKKAILYNEYSLITNFLLETHLERLEKFQVTEFCAGRQVPPGRNKVVPTDFNNFYSNLNYEVGKMVEADSRNQNFKDYEIGDNRLTVKFKINDKGVPIDVTKISHWGSQFVEILSRNLRSQTKFSNNGAVLYFHLVISVNDGNLLQYKYNFSESPDK